MYAIRSYYGIETYVKNAADLTRQLLGFARGGKYEVKAIDINRLIDENVAMFGRTKKELSHSQDIAKKSAVVRNFHPTIKGMTRRRQRP